jgi:lysozyme
VSKRPIAIVAAVLGAAALATPLIGEFEGSVPVGYVDPVGIPTSCVGHTGPDAVVGRRYTEAECANQLAADAVKHGLEIAPCLPDSLPVETRAAFTSFAFNVGTRAFCKSTLSRKAKAGDLRGACEELPRWNRAGGIVMRGLTRRRAAERELCLEGLS